MTRSPPSLGKDWLMPWAVAAVVLGTVPGVHANEDAVRAQVEQKLKLSAAMLADNATLQRVAASGNPAAMSNLDEGRVHHAHAQDQLARGNLQAARQAVDEALRHIGVARRLAPDLAGRQASLRHRYEQHLASTERLVQAWRSRASTAGESERGAVTSALGLLDAARQHASSGRYESAQASLASAEKDVLEGMARLIGTTVDYTPRFANAQEEFIHELTRHQALLDLLPVAIRDLQPREQARALIEQHRQRSHALQAQAVQEHSAGQTERALPLLRDAIHQLQQGLVAAGLVMPVEARN